MTRRMLALGLAAALILPGPALASGGHPATAAPSSLELASAGPDLSTQDAAAAAALTALGTDLGDLSARAALAAAAASALTLLDAAEPTACLRDWWTIERAAYWLLARTAELLDAHDAAVVRIDEGARMAIEAEAGLVVPSATRLLKYAPQVRAEAVCP